MERQKDEASGQRQSYAVRVSKRNDSIKVLACGYSGGSAVFLFWVLVR